MNILFICKYNRFRSKVAEAYFNRINKNKNIKAESAGIIQVDKPLGISEKRRNKILKEVFNLNINEKSRGITVRMLEKADKIIVAANDIPKEVFNNKNDRAKLEIWNIEDEKAGERDKVIKLTKQIISRINELIDKLNREMKK
jgi:protein-tyrosine-phosphatase